MRYKKTMKNIYIEPTSFMRCKVILRKKRLSLVLRRIENWRSEHVTDFGLDSIKFATAESDVNDGGTEKIKIFVHLFISKTQLRS